MRIAFCGKARAGKTTAADILAGKFVFTKISFAEKLKQDMARALALLDAEYYPGNPPSEHLMTHYKNMQDPAKKHQYRDFLQNYGQWRRDYYAEDFWLQVVDRQIKESPDANFVLDDLRHFNEADFLRERGFILVRVDRKDSGLKGAQAEHVTEKNADLIKVDAIISNNLDFNSLANTLDELVLTYIGWKRQNNAV